MISRAYQSAHSTNGHTSAAVPSTCESGDTADTGPKTSSVGSTTTREAEMPDRRTRECPTPLSESDILQTAAIAITHHNTGGIKEHASDVASLVAPSEEMSS